MDWAGEIHEEVDSAIDRFVSFVRVNTGEEARPVGAAFVLWVGGETQPTHMSGGDMWMSEGEPVPVAPSIITSFLNSLNVSVPFAQTLVATGTIPITWAVTSGTLPAGLSMNTSGSVSGTPTTVAAYSFTVTATNSVGTDVQAYTGSVNAALTPPTITTTTLSGMTQGVAFSQTLAATGDTPLSWAVTAGSLPTGLTLNSSTGAIAGTPSGSGSYSFTVSATNSAGTDPQAYSGTIAAGAAPPDITTTSLGTVTATVAYTRTLTATGATPITWAVTTGSLPAGLSLNGTTGVISGTPTTTGAYSFTITATNSTGSDPQAFTGSVISSTPGRFWFGTTNTPDSANVYSDGGATIATGNHWYSTVPWIALGVRLWTPASADSTFLNADLTVMVWARDWQGSSSPGPLDHTDNPPWSTPQQTKTYTDTRVAGTWTPIYFDTPININAVSASVNPPDCLLIAVRWGTLGYYVITADSTVPTAGDVPEVPSVAGDGLRLPESPFQRSAFTTNGTTGESTPGNFWYGQDLIYDLP
jgi:hypothetical protein